MTINNLFMVHTSLYIAIFHTFTSTSIMSGIFKTFILFVKGGRYERILLILWCLRGICILLTQITKLRTEGKIRSIQSQINEDPQN
jgi:hypothetical protein